MSEATSASSPTAAGNNSLQVADVVARQLQGLLTAGNYDGVKLLLEPVQPVDCAEAIGRLPRTLQALAFRLLVKNEAIEVYEYLDPGVQQSLLERLRSGEVLELVEEMSPDDRVRLFDELPAKVVRRLLMQLSPAERRVTAQLLGYEAETAGRLMTTEFIDLKEFHSAAQAPRHCPPPGPRNRDRLQPLCHRWLPPSHRHPLAAGSGHRRARRPHWRCDDPGVGQRDHHHRPGRGGPDHPALRLPGRAGGRSGGAAGRDRHGRRRDRRDPAGGHPRPLRRRCRAGRRRGRLLPEQPVHRGPAPGGVAAGAAGGQHRHLGGDRLEGGGGCRRWCDWPPSSRC